MSDHEAIIAIMELMNCTAAEAQEILSDLDLAIELALEVYRTPLLVSPQEES